MHYTLTYTLEVHDEAKLCLHLASYQSTATLLELLGSLELRLPPDVGCEVVDQCAGIEDQCTPLVARWCPVHGDCSCSWWQDDMDDAGCPLHGAASTHGAARGPGGLADLERVSKPRELGAELEGVAARACARCGAPAAPATWCESCFGEEGTSEDRVLI